MRCKGFWHIYGSLNNSFKLHQKIIPSITDNLTVPYRFSPSASDLFDVIDEEGNVLVSIKDAVDSDQLVVSDPGFSRYISMDYDLQIIDSEGNIGFAILNGLALTNQRLSGKKISILGDSISTYEGYIPEGYATYYPRGNLDSVTETWWYKLANELNMNIVRNASWSGSRVSGDSQGSTAAAGCSNARINDLSVNGETPDIVIVYISTNDWSSGVPVGSFTNKDLIPSEGVISEISKAYALMLYKIRTTYPSAYVYCVTSLEGRAVSGDTDYPIVNSAGETIHDVNHAISEIAHIFGCQVIDLNVSGIHYWNVANYTVDGRLHPNEQGAEIIKEVIKQEMLNTYHNM